MATGRAPPGRFVRHEARSLDRSGNAQVSLIRIAPRPRFTRLDRTHDGMTRRLEMGAGMVPSRAVAAPDIPAGHAHPELQPREPIALRMTGMSRVASGSPRRRRRPRRGCMLARGWIAGMRRGGPHLPGVRASGSPPSVTSAAHRPDMTVTRARRQRYSEPVAGLLSRRRGGASDGRRRTSWWPSRVAWRSR